MIPFVKSLISTRSSSSTRNKRQHQNKSFNQQQQKQQQQQQSNSTLPLHYSYNKNNTSSSSTPSLLCGTSTRTNTTNNFLLGGQYYPSKDKNLFHHRRHHRTNTKCIHLFCSSTIRCLLSSTIVLYLLCYCILLPIVSNVYEYYIYEYKYHYSTIVQQEQLKQRHVRIQHRNTNPTNWLLINDRTTILFLSKQQQQQQQQQQKQYQYQYQSQPRIVLANDIIHTIQLSIEQHTNQQNINRLKLLQQLDTTFYNRYDTMHTEQQQYKQQQQQQQQKEQEEEEALIIKQQKQAQEEMEVNEEELEQRRQLEAVKDEQQQQQQQQKETVQRHSIDGSNQSNNHSTSIITTTTEPVVVQHHPPSNLIFIPVDDTRNNNTHHNNDYSNMNHSSNIIVIYPKSSNPKNQSTVRTLNNYDNNSIESKCTSITKTNTTKIISISTTLLIQCSYDRLWILNTTCQRWINDPIIIIVTITTQQQLHTIYNTYSTTVWYNKCSHVQILIYNMIRNESQQQEHNDYYPINTLRNIALDYVQTSHVLMIDIDFIPSYKLNERIQSTIQTLFIRNNSSTTTSTDTKTAIVIPAFERIVNPPCTNATICQQYLAANTSFIPSTIQSLTTCLQTNDCIVFQSNNNYDGHSSTLTNIWYKQQQQQQQQQHLFSNNDTAIEQPRQIKCFDSYRYEPYVVIPWCPTSSNVAGEEVGKNIQENQQQYLHNNNNASTTGSSKPLSPYYDERFYGYGKNKIQYISHLRYMGYTFVVLPNDGFIVHNPHIESSMKVLWNSNTKSTTKINNTIHHDMDQLYQRYLVELHLKYEKQKNRTTPIIRQCSSSASRK